MDQKSKQLLQGAGEAAVSFSKKAGASLENVFYEEGVEEGNEKLTVTIMFQTVDDFLAMSEKGWKDSFIEVYLKYLINHKYSFGTTPHIRFEFDMRI